MNEEQRDQLEAAARHLYGLIHARFIITSRGLSKMVRLITLPSVFVYDSDTHSSVFFCFRSRSTRKPTLEGALVYFATVKRSSLSVSRISPTRKQSNFTALVVRISTLQNHPVTELSMVPTLAAHSRTCCSWSTQEWCHLKAFRSLVLVVKAKADLREDCRVGQQLKWRG